MGTERALKAYDVVEWWRVGKNLTVYAHTAAEAKRKVREPGAFPEGTQRHDVIVNDQVYPQPKGLEIRRDPSEDRDA